MHRSKRGQEARGADTVLSGLHSTTLRIGDAAPPLALPDLDGKEQYLFDILAQNPVLVVFAPGSWSPNTRQQVHALLEAHDAFVENGVAIVMIVTEDPRTAQRLVPNDGPVFPILIDDDREAARDYGVYRAFSLDGLRVTRPAAFLIDQDGVLRFVYVGHGDRDTPDVPGLLRLCSWLLPRPSVPEPLVAAAEMVATEEEEGLDALATMAVRLVESETGEPVETTEAAALSDVPGTEVVADAVSDGVDSEPVPDEVDEARAEPSTPQETPPEATTAGEETSPEGLANESAGLTAAPDGEVATSNAALNPDSNGEVHDPSDARDGKETALSGQGTG